MLGRSFRSGLLVGVLGGAVAAVLKMVQGRSATATSSTAPAPAPWTPIPDAPPVVVPPRPATPPRPRPDVSIADLQEGPAPAKKAAAPAKKKAAAKPAPWVEAVDGECPPTHPVKAKMSSKIYHLPGGFNYARTKPDRCYVDAAAAEADGLRPSKR